MSKDYVEELLQSVDTIVSARLGDLAYDRTIVCTIVDSSERESGKYTVTDGSMTFEAYSEKSNYSDNMQVQVVIPGGDWTQQKTIIGRCATEDTPIIYRSPTSKIANLSGNLVDRTEADVYELAASGVEEVNGKECRISIPIEKLNVTEYETSKYDTLCIKGDFRSWLADYNITSGNYGVGVIINQGKITECVFTLDSANDMFGAIYNFVDWVSQEQAFAIPKNIEKIETLDFYFYQDGKFAYIDENGNNIALIPFDNGAGVFISNLFVQNLEIYLGSETASVGVEIYSTSSLTYRPQDTERVVKLLWNDPNAKDNEDPLIGIEEIQWFVDDSKGILQQKTMLDKKTTEITINCYTSLTHINVQAKVIRIENSADNKVVYESNLLTFNNYIEKTETVPMQDIEFRFVDIDGYTREILGTDISYSCYNDNYETLEDENTESSSIKYQSFITRRTRIQWKSKSESITEDFWEGATIEITFPEEESSMILRAPVFYPFEENYRTGTTKNPYTVVNIDKDDTTWKDFSTSEKGECYYYIAPIYDIKKTNNKIVYTITLPQTEEEKNQGKKPTVFTAEKIIGFDFQYTELDEDNNTAIEVSPSIKINDIADEKVGGLKSYIEGNEYLTQERTFKALTDNYKAQGIFKDDTGNLYINGSYISTGILRSNNWDGKLTYHPENGVPIEYDKIEKAEAAVEKGDASWDGDWSLSATSGTYWNLNNGQLFAKKFEVNALDNNNKGIYLNSAPLGDQSYFRVGNPGQANFFDYNKDGNITIQTNSKFILNAWKGSGSSYQGIYLNSDADRNGIYFRVGSANKNMEEDQKELVAENLIQVDTTGVRIAANQFTLKANNIYLDSETSQFRVGDNNKYMEYQDSELTIKGTLKAGGWTMGGGMIVSDSYNDTNSNFIGFLTPTKIASSSAGSDVFLIRIQRPNGIDYDDNFRINSDGTVLCRKLNAQGGNISGWTFDDRCFYRNYSINNTDYCIAFDLKAFDGYNDNSRLFATGPFKLEYDSSGKVKDWGDKPTFSIKPDGTMYCRNAIIENASITGLNLNNSVVTFMTVTKLSSKEITVFTDGGEQIILTYDKLKNLGL